MALGGCGDVVTEGYESHLKNTEGYDGLVQAFQMSEEQACEYLQKALDWKLYPENCVKAVVGDYYFSPYFEKFEIPLSGHYIHGNTGEVELRETEYSHNWNKPTKIPQSVYRIINAW